MTVHLAMSLPIVPYIHRIYTVLANSTHTALDSNNIPAGATVLKSRGGAAGASIALRAERAAASALMVACTEYDACVVQRFKCLCFLSVFVCIGVACAWCRVQTLKRLRILYLYVYVWCVRSAEFKRLCISCLYVCMVCAWCRVQTPLRFVYAWCVFGAVFGCVCMQGQHTFSCLVE
jgi:hypothetical protein